MKDNKVSNLMLQAYKTFGVIGCFVFAMFLSFTTKDIIEYQSYALKEELLADEKMLESISLSRTSVVVEMGKTDSISVTAYYDVGSAAITNECSWTGYDISIISVSNGSITAKKAGSTRITVSYTYDGITEYAYCNVTVNEAEVFDWTLTVSPSSMNLEVGKTGKVTIDSGGATGSASVAFRSDNTSIATVTSAGVVTAVSPGTTTIYVAAEINGVAKTGSCQVTVTSTACQESITLNKTSASLNLGSSNKVELVATYKGPDCSEKVLSGSEVTWYTTDTHIATVTNGVVTAVEEGSCVITASYGSVSKTANITVSPVNICNNALVLSENSVTLSDNGTVTLTAKRQHTNCGQQTVSNSDITWTSSNEKIVTVTNGVVKVVGSGTATITASYGGYTDTCSIIVKGYNGYTVSISPEKLYLAKNGDSENVYAKVLDSNGNSVEDVVLSITNRGYTEETIGSYSASRGFTIKTTSKSTGEVTDTISVCISGTPICDTYQAYIYCTKWTVVNSIRSFKLGYSLGEAHLNQTCYYRDPSDCEVIKDENGNIIEYKCSRYYNRCCGSSSGGSTTTPTYACYKDANDNYKWATSAPSGYTLVENISTEANCKPTETVLVYACYKDTNDNYTWATSAPAGYTIVSGVDKETDCKKVETYACYKDNNDNYTWATSAPEGYALVENIDNEINCKKAETPACYKDVNDRYVWGLYANNSDYTLILDIQAEEECQNTIDVPITAASVASVIYIAIIIMITFGSGLIYWYRNKES